MPESLPVLYLTINPNRASTTVPTEGWFRCLRPRGLEPVLVSHQAGVFHEWAVAQGIAAYSVPLPFPRKTWPWPFFRSLWRLRQLVRRHGIRLIHCNEQDVYPIGSYLGRLCRLPVVVSIHCSITRAFAAWAFAGRRCPARIFFVSRRSLEVCRPSIEGIIPPESRRVLPNGIDLERFRPEPARRQEFRQQLGADSAFLLGIACSLRVVKQLEHLFEAVARVHAPAVRLLVAGGPDPRDPVYGDQLMALGKQKLGERLTFLGHLDDLRGFYNGLDLYMNTSKEEACSISILEAMACGCPVVGYASTSVDEQILPGGGEIVGQDEIEELSAAIDRWAESPPRHAQGRSGARRRAEDSYDMRRIAGQLWDEYSATVSEAS